jgi:hypothetical protein
MADELTRIPSYAPMDGDMEAAHSLLKRIISYLENAENEESLVVARKIDTHYRNTGVITRGQFEWIQVFSVSVNAPTRSTKSLLEERKVPYTGIDTPRIVR